MKKLVERIKYERIISDYIKTLRIAKFMMGGKEYTQVSGPTKANRLHYNGSKMVISYQAIEMDLCIKYDRYSHDKLIEFVGTEYEYILNHISDFNNYTTISIEEYERYYK